MGKAIVIIFAALSLLVVPVSILYIANAGTPPVYTIDLQGRFFDFKFGGLLGNDGFTFFKFSSTGGLFFYPDTWNDAYSSDIVLGILPAGTLMMILWCVSIGLILIGFIIAFFKLKISGIFFILACIVDVLQGIVWWLGVRGTIDPSYTLFPIPIAALFLLATGIIAFTSKKKESYYYSPGYSYGYGRR
ncbi:MAG: hypothetical protein FK734_07230 [Asgard group archaeon]|nr:hypothetical protein [Asgard group archaeon]